jgi:hypothetical protein
MKVIRKENQKSHPIFYVSSTFQNATRGKVQEFIIFFNRLDIFRQLEFRLTVRI